MYGFPEPDITLTCCEPYFILAVVAFVKVGVMVSCVPSVMVVADGTSETDVGLEYTVVELDAADGGPFPAELRGVTVKVYGVPAGDPSDSTVPDVEG